MVDSAQHRTIRDHLKHPKDFRKALRHHQAGVVTFAWEEIHEFPHNPCVVICFHPYSSTNLTKWISRNGDVSLNANNPCSMGIVLARQVWNDLIAQGCELWSPEEENTNG